MFSIIGPAFGASVSDATWTPPHAQHGVTVLIGVEREVRVIGRGGSRVDAHCVLVPPDVEHAVVSEGPVVGFLYDVEFYHRVAGAARGMTGPRPLDAALGRRLRGATCAHRAELRTRHVVEGLGKETAAAFVGATPSRVDRRVGRALEALRDPAVDRRRLVAESGLSEAHLQALFVRDVGVPMKTVRLWNRLVAAVISLRTDDATRAAHVAGFSDLAHFSRTCRRMLGYSPSEMRRALSSASAGGTSAGGIEARDRRDR